MSQVYIGHIIHTKSLDEFEVFVNGFIAVAEDGIIIDIGSDYNAWSCTRKDLFGVVQLQPKQFLMPGLIDCHIHAPQVAQIGLGLDLPLLDWLNKYTFPLEAKFVDESFAKKVYSKVVETTIRNGTTLASYFGTNSKDSTLILAREAIRQGQRALIGKVCSDQNCPNIYIETTSESVEETKKFVSGIEKLGSPLVKATITPRFALSGTKELLSELGKIARNHNLHIQSHISESIAEIEFVKSIFGSSYAKAYDDAGLLTNKTIMAHAVHLEDEEITLLQQRGTAIAHCPSSNTNLSSGLCDVQRFMKNGLKVGLGTDVSGGNSISIKDAILRALDVSHHIEFAKKQDIKGTGCVQFKDENYNPINYKQGIYLATLGGAQALAMDTVTGNFVKGKYFDALLIDTSVYPILDFDVQYGIGDGYINAESQLIEMVQRFIYVGDDRNISKVFVAGKQIKKIN